MRIKVVAINQYLENKQSGQQRVKLPCLKAEVFGSPVFWDPCSAFWESFVARLCNHIIITLCTECWLTLLSILEIVRAIYTCGTVRMLSQNSCVHYVKCRCFIKSSILKISTYVYIYIWFHNTHYLVIFCWNILLRYYDSKSCNKLATSSEYFPIVYHRQNKVISVFRWVL